MQALLFFLYTVPIIFMHLLIHMYIHEPLHRLGVPPGARYDPITPMSRDPRRGPGARPTFPGEYGLVYRSLE